MKRERGREKERLSKFIFADLYIVISPKTLVRYIPSLVFAQVFAIFVRVKGLANDIAEK